MPQYDYQARKAGRIARLTRRAEKLRAESAARIAKGTAALDIIPLGQPILVDHYSAKSCRSYRAKANANIEKGYEMKGEAEKCERSIDAAVRNESISSNDPEAVTMLKEKLAELNARRDAIKAENAAARKAGTPGRPAYELTNLGANIRAVELRIKTLTAEASRETLATVTVGSGTISEDREENKIRVTFPGRLSEEDARTMKAHGFNWSRTRTAWVRMANVSAYRRGIHALEKIAHVEAAPVVKTPTEKEAMVDKAMKDNGCFFAFGDAQFTEQADPSKTYKHVFGGLYCPSENVDALLAALPKK